MIITGAITLYFGLSLSVLCLFSRHAGTFFLSIALGATGLALIAFGLSI